MTYTISSDAETNALHIRAVVTSPPELMELIEKLIERYENSDENLKRKEKTP